MKKDFRQLQKSLLAFPVSALSLAIAAHTYAQDETESPEQPQVNIQNPIEEVLILGRLKSSAGDIVLERMENSVAVDIISFEQISRIGDSTVAAALKRVPGVTLVDDKFVYVRGLGERYSSTLLNGAVVPSPDLSRNVIPLDIFPTSIVENLEVQKMYSPDKPALFGGGSVDIRTTGIPNEFVFSIEVGSGSNSESGDFLTYDGGGDDTWGEDDGTRALPVELLSALNRYKGDFNTILADLRRTNPDATSADAEAVTRNLALALNRDISVYEDGGEPDISAEINIGNLFALTDMLEFGFTAGVSYDSGWRNAETLERSTNYVPGSAGFISFEKESTYNVALTGNLALGFRYGDDHEIETTSIFVRNTDDETSIRDAFDSDLLVEDGLSDRFYNLRYEQREMTINQIRGEHVLGYDTREMLGFDGLSFLDELTFNWYYSDSRSTTDIPNEVSVLTRASLVDPENSREANNVVLQQDISASDYRFTDLEDEVDSRGWKLTLPISTTRWDIDISGGMDYWQKARTYRQLQFGLGSNDVDAGRLRAPLGNIFSDANILNDDLGFEINVLGSNSESYIAANKVNAAFGMFDMTWDNTWRFAGGVRWEDYQQVGLTWDPLDFDGIPIVTSESQGQEAIADELRNATYTDTDYFPSLAVTYMRPDFWAQDFNLRFGYSETTVRPDLREIAESSYRDPITDVLVFGNADVVPTLLKNYDVRAEWFFSNNDSFSVSLYAKEMENPIDQTEAAAGDQGQALEIINAKEGDIQGLEVEFLKNMGDLADWLDPFFLQGNFLVQDTNTVVGPQADAPTNPERALVGASDAVNLILGFDSYDSKHSATLSYNWFGERLYFAGRNGQPDAFEQPQNLLDFTYSYYPTDNLTLKLKLKNLLDEQVEVKRGEATTLIREVGQTYSLSLKYEF